MCPCSPSEFPSLSLEYGSTPSWSEVSLRHPASLFPLFTGHQKATSSPVGSGLTEVPTFCTICSLAGLLPSVTSPRCHARSPLSRFVCFSRQAHNSQNPVLSSRFVLGLLNLPPGISGNPAPCRARVMEVSVYKASLFMSPSGGERETGKSPLGSGHLSAGAGCSTRPSSFPQGEDPTAGCPAEGGTGQFFNAYPTCSCLSVASSLGLPVPCTGNAPTATARAPHSTAVLDGCVCFS